MSIISDVISKHLSELETVTEEILKVLNPEDLSGCAVNWGSLHVVEARYVVTLGYEQYEVVIDEVAPEDRRFASFIEGELGDLGYEAAVITEW